MDEVVFKLRINDLVIKNHQREVVGTREVDLRIGQCELITCGGVVKALIEARNKDGLRVLRVEMKSGRGRYIVSPSLGEDNGSGFTFLRPGSEEETVVTRVDKGSLSFTGLPISVDWER